MSVQPQQAAPMKQLNVLVVGDARVGKTSLIHTLLAYGSSVASAGASADEIVDQVSKISSQSNGVDFIEYPTLKLDSMSLQLTEYTPSSAASPLASSTSSSSSSTSGVTDYLVRRNEDGSPVHVCLQLVSPQSVDRAQAASDDKRWSLTDYATRLRGVLPFKVALTQCDLAADIPDVLKPVISSLNMASTGESSSVHSIASTWNSSRSPKHDKSSKSLFQRRFRWGSFDLLDSSYSDFEAFWKELTEKWPVEGSSFVSAELPVAEASVSAAVAESNSVLVASASAGSLHALEQNGSSATFATLGQKIDYPVTLESVRDNLIRAEESIIFALIERSQFKQNRFVYDPKRWNIPDWNGDFADYFLRETERICARVRRYTSPDEHPFSSPSDLPTPILPPASYPNSLIKNRINVNKKVHDYYRTKVLPQICSDGDDGNYGSSAVCDVACLQQLSKRIHYGKFVAEVKFLSQREKFSELILANDTDRIMELITNSAVEDEVVRRVAQKVENYNAKISNKQNSRLKPKHLAEFYHDFIIPVTKEVQVLYLLRRLEQDL